MALFFLIFFHLLFFLSYERIEVKCEFFTSVKHMHVLVNTELELRDSLERFIVEEENRLARLRMYLNRTILTASIANDADALSKYLGHPVNAFRTISRMSKDWQQTERIVRIDFSKDILQRLSMYRDLIPSAEDVRGAEDALVRLQETYDLPPSVISEGISPKNYPLSKMNAQDTFSIGKSAYEEKNFQRAQLWMAETLRLIDIGRTDDASYSLPRFDVLDHLAWAEYSNGEFEAAYNHTIELQALDPSNERIARNIEIFRRFLKQERARKEHLLKIQSLKKKNGTETKAERQRREAIDYPKFYYTEDEDEYKRYMVEKEVAQKLCRGLVKPIPKSQTKFLVCWYLHKKPKYVLKPARMERIFVKPELVFFRGVLTDDEIQQIKDIASPKLHRATVHNPKTGKLEFADYRVSKSAWLDDEDDPVVRTVNERIGDLTGLSMETAEMLQIANYGIAGHYETHFDFSRSTPIRPPPWKPATEVTHRVKHEIKRSQYLAENGNRIATFLLYLSDVEAGGGTVFTNIGALVKPKKGDAVFWYNLYRDGSGDFDTRHAACPVLIGEKWVANKWIHERGQEFRRTCGLAPDSP